jgi:hypothetical protein
MKGGQLLECLQIPAGLSMKRSDESIEIARIQGHLLRKKKGSVTSAGLGLNEGITRKSVAEGARVLLL